MPRNVAPARCVFCRRRGPTVCRRCRAELDAQAALERSTWSPRQAAIEAAVCAVAVLLAEPRSRRPSFARRSAEGILSRLAPESLDVLARYCLRKRKGS